MKYSQLTNNQLEDKMIKLTRHLEMELSGSEMDLVHDLIRMECELHERYIREVLS